MKESKVEMLVAPKKFEIRKFEIPEISDDEMIIKIEGCGVCGTDGHEYNRDPFGLCPVVLGHEGTGEIVQIGKNVKKDSSGISVKLGDKIVTSILTCGECYSCKNTPAASNMCESLGVYGLFPDDEKHLNGYFADYMLVRKDSNFFNVSSMTLDQRILVEPAAVAVHAVERAKKTGLLSFNTKVLVQGCGPIGLLVLAVLRTMGIENIIAVDGNKNRLELAEKMGADKCINFTEFNSFEDVLKEVKECTNGLGADFVFQCTGVAKAGGNSWKLIRRGGGLCEVGFFMDGGECSINHHQDLCNKEVTAVGSWVYTVQDYPITFDFLKRADAIGLPINDLITHKFSLEQITDALEANVSMKGIKIAIVNQ
ncbi:MAG TPA: zinc-binding dehydrogenase [Victivallales bacterium]|nr:zinc-binding dehydrogenase [Victivallales bacterium]